MKIPLKKIFLGLLSAMTFTSLVSCEQTDANKSSVTDAENVTIPKLKEQETFVKEKEIIVVSDNDTVIEEKIIKEDVILQLEGEKTLVDPITKKEHVIQEIAQVKTEKPTEQAVVQKEVEKELAVLTIDHSIWNGLLKKNVSAAGKVNYKGFKADQGKLEQYITLLKSKTPNNDWSKNEELAYWINVYNVFTVQLIVANYPLKSITNLEKPWDKKMITIQGKTYSLGEVENNILRKMGEPRIHFAINCASVSCPKLLNEAFTSEKLSSQLRTVTKAFLLDKTKNQLTDGEIKISKLFEWYAADFSNGNIIDFINKYSGQPVSSNSKITYLDYNWNLNE